MTPSRPLRARQLGFAGLGVFAWLVGCRGILGIHDERAIACFASSDCPAGAGEVCDSNECVFPGGPDAGDGAVPSMGDRGEPGDGAHGGDGSSEAADARPSGPTDANAEVSADAPIVDGTDGSDASVDRADGTGAADAPRGADGNGASDASDASIVEAADAHDAANIDAGADAADGAAPTCSVGPAGVCAACTAACTVGRPGWLQTSTSASFPAQTFVAVRVDVPNPSWLLRLGVDAIGTGTNCQLALYEDSGGQPGALVTNVDVTTEDDPQNDGTEQSVGCSALCQPLTAGSYWVGAVFANTTFVRSDGVTGTDVYEAAAGAYPTGESLGDGVVPSGTLFPGALDRNLYIVVTQP